MTACSSTTIVSSWKSPDADANAESLKKVMVAVLVKDEATRRYTEGMIVKKNEALFPSYDLFTSKEIMEDTERCKQMLSAQGFDGVVTMQLLSIEESQNYVPGTYASGGYWGYHGYFYPGYYSPGYYTTDSKYIISTNVFSLKENKLLWSGVTSTLNPTSIDKTLAELSSVIHRQMVKDKFITE